MDRKKFDEMMAESEKKIADIQKKIETNHQNVKKSFADALGAEDVPERARYAVRIRCRRSPTGRFEPWRCPDGYSKE